MQSQFGDCSLSNARNDDAIIHLLLWHVERLSQGLINAALELEKPERTPVFLQKINQVRERHDENMAWQAAISPKDHILHFRCYVQLGNAHAAEELWRRLGFETTSLMLNLPPRPVVWLLKSPQVAAYLGESERARACLPNSARGQAKGDRPRVLVREILL